MRLASSTMRILVCLALGVMATGPADGVLSAQVLYGSIVGTLTDQTGAVVPKAVVTVTNTSTGLSRQATADDAGYYSIRNLPEGRMTCRFPPADSDPYTQKGVNVPSTP